MSIVAVDWYAELRRRNLTIEDLATLCGVSGAYIRMWQAGYRRPSPEHCRIIERELGVPRSTLRPDLYAD